MASFPTCSLLISTYNWPAALRLCLLSAFQQSVLPEMIVVCDDGSREDTKALIDQLRPQSPVPLVHVWQPDEGFRVASARNKGIARITSAYIVQADGDIILSRDFIHDHLVNAKPGRFLSGNRYYLSPEVSAGLLTQQTLGKIPFTLEKSSWKRLRLPLLQPLMARYYHWSNEHQYILGCNISFWRQDLLEANGYDEGFSGWGWEDVEVALRLINKGIRLAFIRFGAVQFHIYHKEASRDKETENYQKALLTIENKITSCQLGVNQYLLTPSSGAN